MRSLLFAMLLCLVTLPLLRAQSFSPTEIATWRERAQSITIIRDTWGIPHIYAETDADAVFGMLYAQCEDDFRRVERNYLDALGLMAPTFGEPYIYHDLRARMFMDSAQAKQLYADSPKWLRKLCDAFAQGINYYLATHPEAEPQGILRYEPWMPFFFSEGSIGGDITRISLLDLAAFYEQTKVGWQAAEAFTPLDEEPTGSNGFAIAPQRSKSGNALLLINPHTSFYFRSEQQVVSEEGLNAYGAVTWGQFFIYQGFNERCGWMHTSTRADAIDEYRETVERRDDGYYYRYGKEWRQVEEETITLPYRSEAGMKQRQFTIYRTHHGPVTHQIGDNWITFRMMERPTDALRQSFLRTKAKGYKSFRRTMKIRTNSSNNTVYADAQGNIAYWHGNFIPERDPAYDYSGLIDGSTPATDWDGLHKLKDLIEVRNPETGWLQNCNSTPYTAAGPASPDPTDYPTYVAPDRENFRGLNAVRVLDRIPVYDLDSLIAAANDPTLTAFEDLIPAVVQAYRDNPEWDPRGSLREVIDLLDRWDFSYGENSVATALAIYWGERIWGATRSLILPGDYDAGLMMDDLILKYSSGRKLVDALRGAKLALERDFGRWRTPWGAINRFQRLTGQIDETFDDTEDSIPVGFTSSRWGSLASYGARTYPGTKVRYGSGGNSFVAVVEFGDRLRARAVVSGGQSSDPDSPHFTDQAELFCDGEFREVYFYRPAVEAQAERTYRPGEREE